MIKLNVACGDDIQEGFINIDIQPTGDLQLDIRKGLPFCDNTVEHILSKHTLEHLTFEEVVDLMNEFGRILINGGTLRAEVPHRKGDGAWTITHKSYWDEATFDFFRQERSKILFNVKYLWTIEEMNVNEKPYINVLMKVIKTPIIHEEHDHKLRLDVGCGMRG